MTHTNTQASGFVVAINSPDFQDRSMEQIVWLAENTACYRKVAENYRLVMFWDGSVLRIQDNLMGVAASGNWEQTPYAK